MKNIARFFFLLMAINIKAYEQDLKTDRPVTIAILAKDKEHCLITFLDGIFKQTFPKSKTYLYIRTNDNNDETARILKSWVEKVKNHYLGVYFDDSDAPVSVKEYGQHEWNCTRFKVLGQIRQDSLDWAHQHNSHYFVADCDNFILPHTIQTMVDTNLPIVAPLLHSKCAYSNFHANVDENGYMIDSPFYLPLVNQEIKGHVQVPVVHCTYFIRHEILPEMCYDDESYRYEYAIFSDNARKKGIPQYLDTTDVFGYVSFAENSTDLVCEPWFISYSTRLHSFNKNNAT
jgi:hypothetical protein